MHLWTCKDPPASSHHPHALASERAALLILIGVVPTDALPMKLSLVQHFIKIDVSVMLAKRFLAWFALDMLPSSNVHLPFVELVKKNTDIV